VDAAATVANATVALRLRSGYVRCMHPIPASAINTNNRNNLRANACAVDAGLRPG